MYLVNNSNVQLYICILLEYSRYSCYIKMHGMKSFTIVDAQQARSVSICMNTKYQLLKTSAAIWHNKTCRNSQLTPKCVNIGIKGDI